MMLLKFACEVTKCVYGVTDVFDVIIISQDYICIWQSNIIYIRTANKFLRRLESRCNLQLLLTFYSINFSHVKGFNCNMIETS